MKLSRVTEFFFLGFFFARDSANALITVYVLLCALPSHQLENWCNPVLYVRMERMCRRKSLGQRVSTTATTTWLGNRGSRNKEELMHFEVLLGLTRKELSPFCLALSQL